MDMELTNTEKTKVIAMYIPCDGGIYINGKLQGSVHRIIAVGGFEDGKAQYVRIRVGKTSLVSDHFVSNITMHLRHLSQLTDDEAVEVAKIGEIYSDGKQVDYLAAQGKELLKTYFTSSRCNVQGKNWFAIMQYLISVGIAVPLFFAPGHPANGQTAIELGLALNQTESI